MAGWKQDAEGMGLLTEWRGCQVREYSVYIHTSPSGKKYVGITGRQPIERWANGKGYRSNKHFYNAIQKYGWEKISHEIVYSGLTKEEACEKEQQLIAKYKSDNEAFGYNLTSGGEHYEFPEEVKNRLRKPHDVSQEQREIMSKRGKTTYEKYLKGRTITQEEREKRSAAQTGKTQSEETIQKRVNSLKAKWSSQGGLTKEHRDKISKALHGRTFSEETLKKMKDAKSPQNNPRSRKVRQIKDGRCLAEYCSARAAERETGVSYTSISRCCRGDRLKSAGGFVWEYVS